MCRRGAVRVVAGVVVATCLVGLTPSASATTTTPVTTTWGYIPMQDGARLRYTVVRPAGAARRPVALNYGPYFNGSDPQAWSFQTDRFVAAGYAVLGVNLRGSGCSTGELGLIDRQQTDDAVAVIAWAAKQPWSNGHLGMFGLSYPGIVQYGPASRRIPHLDAIAPFQTMTDLYRQAAFPGGSLNAGFAALWGFALQPEASVRGVTQAVAKGDRSCAGSFVGQQLGEPYYVDAVPVLQHPFDDLQYFDDRRIEPMLKKIDIPVLGCLSWQDEMLGSGSFHSFDMLPKDTSWAIVTNGYHGTCDAPSTWPYLRRFFDRYVKGVDNGFDASPHVIELHESTGDLYSGVQQAAAVHDQSHPAWTSTYAKWPVPVDPVTLHFNADYSLDRVRRTGDGGLHSFVSPLPSAGNENGYFGEWNALWKLNAVPAQAVRYTTPTLARDAQFFGPGSADVWLTSTARDTDVQVTLSEIRPDGQEVFVQRGWLRASHRALDRARSTVLSPYQTHREADATPVVPGQPIRLRIELSPFGYVFRAGSRLRITVDTPLTTGLWAVTPSATPARNTILHDTNHDSAVVLGLVRGGRAHAPMPKCDTLLNQPCRSALGALPKGRLDLSGS